MRLKTDSFQNIENEIRKSGKKIIVYGAGVIGRITTPAILRSCHLEASVEFYIDNSPDKRDEMLPMDGRELPIYHSDILNQINVSEYVVFLAISRFAEVLEELDQNERLQDLTCYIVPMLCIDNFSSFNDEYVPETKGKIPKTIHYVWLGGGILPKSLQYCIETWKRFCPDYDIIRWDETNYDFKQNDYMRQAYEAGAYGFVPDYARVDILYQNGGIYLDTDVELIKSLDALLNREAFCCVEKWQTINLGGGSGAVAGHHMLKEMRDFRNEIKFIDEKGRLNKTTCGYYDTQFFQKSGYKINGQTQIVNGMTVYTYDYFHPFDYMSGQTKITDNTYGIHHFSGSWMDEGQIRSNENTERIYDEIYDRSVKK